MSSRTRAGAPKRMKMPRMTLPAARSDSRPCSMPRPSSATPSTAMATSRWHDRSPHRDLRLVRNPTPAGNLALPIASSGSDLRNVDGISSSKLSKIQETGQSPTLLTTARCLSSITPDRFYEADHGKISRVLCYLFSRQT